VLADATPGIIGRVLLLVASTGLAWGVAATAVGARAPSAKVAAFAGLVVMVGAVLVYYSVAGWLGLRPAPDWLSLRYAGTVWALLGLVAGPTLGSLGWHATRATGAPRSVLWGVLGGALLSQAVFLMPRDAEGVSHLLSAEAGPLVILLLLGVAIPIAVVVVGSRRRHLGVGLAVMAAVGLLGALAWSLVQRLV
jgi:hypothetical protein